MIEQSGVVNRRDADDRLWAVGNSLLWKISTRDFIGTGRFGIGLLMTILYKFLNARISLVLDLKTEIN